MKWLQGYYNLQDDLERAPDFATRYILRDRQTGVMLFSYVLFESARLKNPWIQQQLDMMMRKGDLAWLRTLMRVLVRFPVPFVPDEGSVLYERTLLVNGYALFRIKLSPFSPSP